MGSSCTKRKAPQDFNGVVQSQVGSPCSTPTPPDTHKEQHNGQHNEQLSEQLTRRSTLLEPSIPALPRPVAALRNQMYDPNKTHENYLHWSKTRLSQRNLATEVPACVSSDVSFTLVTPQGSGNREMGRSVLVLDDRRRGEDSEDVVYFVSSLRPQVAPGELWTDSEFSVEVAMSGMGEKVYWKRPSEICERPVLFADGSSRYDVGQGSAGTCWFLSILTALADKPDYLSQIIGPDAYHVGRASYDGVFHCRLWRLGSWHDVYVDDHLPVSMETNKLWGAHSATDDNEMWVALMEKAFARFYGGYGRVKGGCAGDAFVTLTGGVEEDLMLDKVAPPELFSRLDNALRAGAILACSVPPEHDGQFGLTGGHAYTITGIAQVPYRGRIVSLLRIRNPWGTGGGEWRGAWSDGAPEWAEVSEDVIHNLNYQSAMDGEFWISLFDFYTYFWRAFICNFSPDFDRDGTPDGLDRVWTILGQFHSANENAETNDTRADIMKQPKYIFKLTEPDSTQLDQPDGLEAGSIPVVIQFLQESMDNLLYVRLDLFKVEQQWHMDKRHILLREITKDKVFMASNDVTYRYALRPGQYVVVPNYSKSRRPRKMRNFCLRIFTTSKLACSTADWNDKTHVYLNNFHYFYNDSGYDFQLSNVRHFAGEWQEGSNSGGQACRGQYHTNPQISIYIPGVKDMPLGICITQEQRRPVVPLGVDIFKVTSGDVEVPLDKAALEGRQALEQCAETLSGSFLFLRAPEATGYYILPVGHYVIVLFSDDVTDQKQFIVTLATERHVQSSFYQGR